VVLAGGAILRAGRDVVGVQPGGVTMPGTGDGGTGGTGTGGTGTGGTGGQDNDKPPNIKELTTAADALLKDLGLQNTAAIDLIGGVATLMVGGLGGVGTAAAVAGVLGDIISILSPSGSSQASLGQIYNQLQKLVQAEQATADEARRTNIQNDLGNAVTVAGSLQDLKNHPPQTHDDVRSLLLSVSDSMVQLAPPDVSGRGCQAAGNYGGPWTVPFNYLPKWTDIDSPHLHISVYTGAAGTFSVFCGYGEQDPPTVSAGQVFNYTLVLPAYVYAVSTFLSAGLLIDLTFQQDFSNNVATAVCLLQSVHDFVLAKGMKKLSPGPLTLQNLKNWEFQLSTFAEGHPGVVPGGVEYGVVELFSGFSSMGIYTLGPLSELHQNINYDGAFQILLERRAKDVYRGTGLEKLQETIDNFNVLIGQPTSTGPSPGDWSFRRDIVGPANVTRPDGTVHLSDIKAFLESTSPTPTQTPNPSFRYLLSF
jgi:hypothetical protein